MANGSRFQVLDDEVSAVMQPSVDLKRAVSYAVATATGVPPDTANTKSGPAAPRKDVPTDIVAEVVAKVLATLQPIIIQAVTTAVSTAMTAAMDQLVEKADCRDGERANLGRVKRSVQVNRFEGERLEQYTRKENVKIYGVKEEEKENTTDVVIGLAKEIGVELTKADLSICHRLGSGSSGKRTIIARFTRREAKASLMKRKKELKKKATMKDVYINDDLTRLRSKVVQEMRKDPAILKVWTIDGKIHFITKEKEKEDLSNWVAGWIDWNLDLDLIGGPNWVGNFVDSPIIVNAEEDTFYKQPMYYHLGHFSKFIVPGSVRVGSSSDRDNLVEHLAFKLPDGNMAMVVLNRREFTFPLSIYDPEIGYLNAEIPSRSIQTYLWKSPTN